MILDRWSSKGHGALSLLMKFGLKPKKGGSIKGYRQGGDMVVFAY